MINVNVKVMNVIGKNTTTTTITVIADANTAYGTNLKSHSLLLDRLTAYVLGEGAQKHDKQVTTGDRYIALR
jgi:hypothetical protein